MRKAVIVTPGYADHSIERKALEPLGFQLLFADGAGDRGNLSALLSDAELIFVRDIHLDGGLIAEMKKARGIIRYGVGVDNIDILAAKQKNIIVARVPNYGADVEVADHAVALYLAVKRRIVSRDASVRCGGWQIGQAEPIGRIAESVAGFIGFGRIARAVRDRLKAFGVKRFLAHDPYADNSLWPEDVEAVELDNLARQSDIISLHAPATSENRHLISEQFLAKVRPSTILINTSRGTLIDEHALACALAERRLLGVGIDVFEKEPPLGSPLLNTPNTVLSDHTAWYSEATVASLQTGAVDQAIQIIKNGTASEAVNL